METIVVYIVRDVLGGYTVIAGSVVIGYARTVEEAKRLAVERLPKFRPKFVIQDQLW